MPTFAIPNEKNGTPAEVAQLVEHNLAKVGVASSSLVFCSKTTKFRSSSDDLKFWKKVSSSRKYHPTGFNYMSVVLVHKAGFFLYKSPDRWWVPCGLTFSATNLSCVHTILATGWT